MPNTSNTHQEAMQAAFLELCQQIGASMIDKFDNWCQATRNSYLIQNQTGEFIEGFDYAMGIAHKYLAAMTGN